MCHRFASDLLGRDMRSRYRHSGQRKGLRTAMDVSAWWNNAWGMHQAAVPVRFGRESGLAGIPWSFLLSVVKELLTWRDRINAAQLDRDWQRAEQDCAQRVAN